MKLLLSLAAVVTMGLAFGCATSPSERAAQSSGPTGICEVCRHNRDLACVCVHIDETTPRVEHEGRIYYFCSAECRNAFLKKPAKYMPKQKN